MAQREALFVSDTGTYKGDVIMGAGVIQFQIKRGVPATMPFRGAVVLGDSNKPIFVIVTSEDPQIPKRYTLGQLPETVFEPVIYDNRYIYKFPQTVLDELVQMDVMERMEFERVLTCPSCGSLPTVRPGCSSCGSSRIKKEELIHHFRCGFVDKSEYFEQDDGTVKCPKCRATNLICNVDYDITSGLVVCQDCGAKQNSPSLIGDCMSCHTRFLISEAGDQTLYRYIVKEEDDD